VIRLPHAEVAHDQNSIQWLQVVQAWHPCDAGPSTRCAGGQQAGALKVVSAVLSD
jgi:hypothetical protein